MKRFGLTVLLLGAALAAAPADASKWAVGVFPGGEEFELEVVDDPRSRQIGYMHREHVGEREGMLFVFSRDARHGIWMKNCKVALDILWLDPQLRVIHMKTGAEPCPEEGACPATLPDSNARYVLEVAAGTAAALGLQKGQRIDILPEAPPLAPR